MVQKLKNQVVRGLLWSQLYVRTDMVYLASGGFWLMVGQVLSSLSTLALAIAFANLVPLHTYGTYKYVLSLAGIFAIFSLPGMNTALMQATAQGRESSIYAATRSRIFHACIGGIFALAGSAYYFLNGNVQLSLALLIIAATLPLFDTFTTYLSYLVGKKRFDLRTLYQALTQVVSTVVLLVTIFFTDNLILLLLAYFIPLVSIRAALHYRATRAIPDISSPEEDADMKRYGKHLTAMQILNMAASEIDKILIWKFLGPVQVAVYTFALAIPEQIKGPLKGVGDLAFPKFAAQTQTQIRENLPALWRKLALYGIVLFCISLLYAFSAPYIFEFIFPQYMESVRFSQLFAFSMITSVASIPIAILSAQQKTSAQYVISTVQPVIAIGLLVLLIPSYGIMGAIVALLLSKFATLALSLGALFTLK